MNNKILCGKRNKGKYITLFENHAEIDLGYGFVSLIDLEDVDKCKDWNWYLNKDGYVVRSILIDVKAIRLHRIIMNTPKGMDTDHIDHNPLNNRKSNLRICSRSENSMNTITTTGTSKYKGVYWNKKNKKWIAQIKIDYKNIYLGSFYNEEDAAIAYNNKATELFGDFKLVNELVKRINNENN